MTQPEQSSEIMFRAIFDSIPISIWVEDFSAVVTALDTLRDQGVDDLERYLQDHPGETERLVQLIRVLDINQASLALYGATSKDGSTIWLEVEAVSVEEDGKVVGTRSYMWDISTRKQLEAELRESRTSFAAIVDQNTDGITVVDAGASGR